MQEVLIWSAIFYSDISTVLQFWQRCTFIFTIFGEEEGDQAKPADGNVTKDPQNHWWWRSLQTGVLISVGYMAWCQQGKDTCRCRGTVANTSMSKLENTRHISETWRRPPPGFQISSRKSNWLTGLVDWKGWRISVKKLTDFIWIDMNWLFRYRSKKIPIFLDWNTKSIVQNGKCFNVWLWQR